MKRLLVTIGGSLAVFLLGGNYGSSAAEKTTSPPVQTPALDLARQLNDAFINVADKVSPAVVVIQVWHKPGAKQSMENHPFFDALPPEWRRQFEKQQREQERPDRRPRRTPDGSGSGVVIREDGFILTNNHVVEDAERIKVIFSDRREFEAEVKGTDPLSEIAVIKIPAKGLVTARLGDSSKTRVGEFAIAIGAPFELDYSVTIGHVSAKGRSRLIANPGMDQDFIQTDANINPGNSGGPLVNLNGEVIGINTLIRGIGTGIGFAVPINLAKRVSELLISEGKYTRAWLGIRIAALRDAPEIRSFVKDVPDGVVVSTIEPNGPATKSELMTSDIITSVDGTPVRDANELRNEVRSKKIGETVTLDVVRIEENDKITRKKIKVPTAAMPDAEQMASATRPGAAPTQSEGEFGLTVETLTRTMAENLGVDYTAGVVVTEVEAGSLAEEKRITVGDIITKVNQQPVTNIKQFRDALKKSDPKKGVIINLINKGRNRFEILKDED